MSAKTATPKRQLDSVDVAKFVLSIMIAAIHARPLAQLSPFLEPLLRMAVPLFFIIGSYFFFRKQRRATTVDQRISNLEQFVKRNLQLYGFWFIVLLVPTMMYRGWFEEGILWGLLRTANNFLFSSTFVASWYIMASVIATIAIAVLSRRLSNKAILALTVPIYLVCCLMSNYGNTSFTQAHLGALTYGFAEPYNSFWVGLIWVTIGKIVADNEPRIDAIATRHLLIALLGGLALLGCEQFIILSRGYAGAPDCFLTLPFACVPTFLLILKAKVTCRHAKFMRAASTITYCMHGTICITVYALLQWSISPVLVFLFCLAASWVATFAILKLEGLDRLHWLRFSH